MFIGVLPALFASFMPVAIAQEAPLRAPEQAQEPGLGAHWPFDGGTGDTIKDASGQGHDGTRKGAKWTTTGTGTFLRFDGAHDYVDLSSARKTIDKDHDWSLSLYFIAADTRKEQTLFGQALDVDNRVTVQVLGGQIRATFDTGPYYMGPYHSRSEPIVANKCYHLVLTWREGASEFVQYLNGEETTGTRLAGHMSGTGLNIGRDPNRRYYFRGAVDEVKIYNRVLSAADIADELDRSIIRNLEDNGAVPAPAPERRLVTPAPKPKTKDAPPVVASQLQAYEGAITPITSTEPVVNLCRNGGFEIATLPDVPDFWSAHVMPRRITDWWDHWRIDHTVHFEGRSSMRLDNPVDDRSCIFLRYASAYSRKAISIHPGRDYTLSVAMKSRKGFVQVWLDMFIKNGRKRRMKKTVNVGPGWHTYSITGHAAEKDKDLLVIITPVSKGCIWVDAVQVEEGDQAHAYVPCPYLSFSYKNELPRPATETDREPLPPFSITDMALETCATSGTYNAYTVTAMMENLGETATNVMPATRLFTPKHKFAAKGDVICLIPGQKRKVSVGHFVLKDPAMCKVRTLILDEHGRRDLATTAEVNMPVPWILNVRPRYNLYTTDKSAELAIDIQLPDSLIASGQVVCVTIMAPDNTVAVQSTIPALTPSSVYPVAIDALAPGDYQVSASLTAQDGTVIAQSRSVLRKRAPAAKEVRVDYVSRCLVVNGKRFFPYMNTVLRLPEPMERVKEIIRECRDENFNALYCGFRCKAYKEYVTDDKIRAFLDEAHRQDLQVVWWMAGEMNKAPNENGKFKNDGSWEGYVASIKHNISTFKDHPAILAWKLVDEPVYRGVSKDKYFAKKLYDIAVALDPYHPCLINWQKEHLIKQYNLYGGNPLDIIVQDGYPIPRNRPTHILEEVDLTVSCCENRKPVWFAIQTKGIGRLPTPDELTCMVYLFLTHRGNGMTYWPGVWPESRLLKHRMGEIGLEMKKLAPFIMTKDRTDKVTVNTDAIHTLVRGESDCTILIAVNPSDESHDVVLDTGDVRGAPFRRARVLFEDRTAALANGVIHDSFRPLERHVYVLKSDP